MGDVSGMESSTFTTSQMRHPLNRSLSCNIPLTPQHLCTHTRTKVAMGTKSTMGSLRSGLIDKIQDEISDIEPRLVLGSLDVYHIILRELNYCAGSSMSNFIRSVSHWTKLVILELEWVRNDLTPDIMTDIHCLGELRQLQQLIWRNGASCTSDVITWPPATRT